MNRVWRVRDMPAWLIPNITEDKASGCFRVGPGMGVWINSRGYAMVGITGIHRLVYTELIDDIPDGHVIDHVKTRGCVWRNCSMPGHLEAVTSRTNILRGDGITAMNARKDCCSTCGTAYDLLNTYWYPDGRRDCRACRATAREQYVKRQRERCATTLATNPALSLAA
jgi:hypothetical protein